MKKAVRTCLALVLVFCMTLAIGACSKAGNDAGTTGQQDSVKLQETTDRVAETPGEPVKLNVWIGEVSENEKKKSQEEWDIAKRFKKFEQANPGVTIEFSVEPDALQAHQTFKVAGMAKNGPDIAHLWTGNNVFALKEVILPLNDLIPAEDKENIVGWDTVTYNFQKDGDILAYPFDGNQISCIYYNKEIIKRAGLDFEANPPRTTEDFSDACQKILDTGIVPIGEGAASSSPNFYYFGLLYWWAQLSGYDMIDKECRGEAKFVDDRGYIDAFTYYNSLYKKGFINKDTMSAQDVMTKFLQGRYAMMASGGWDLATIVEGLKENAGVILPPNITQESEIKDAAMGGPGACMAVSNYTKSPNVCVKLLSFMSSKPEVLERYKSYPSYPLRKDISAEELGLDNGSTTLAQLTGKLFEFSKNFTFFLDNTMVPEVNNESVKISPLVLTGKMTPQDAAAQLDKKAAQK